MSLTSYRAAPPRVNCIFGLWCAARSLSGGIFDKIPGAAPPRVNCVWLVSAAFVGDDGFCVVVYEGFVDEAVYCIALIDLAATYSPAP